MPRKQDKVRELVMNKIIQKGLTEGLGLKPEIQAIFNQLGITVLKVIHQNGDFYTKTGDQVLICGPKPTMDALLTLFPKGFMTTKHCPAEKE
ncbi:MAG: hypothetical protein A2Y67_01135 [Candidatus Buchananbacteria bacterium RBG_13_39_9]|uniref:RCK C-terminal domain-containing protein n=1 Tax=Candidatus Buchananbacteria bacterium RBG_13_39_9 TaxID=1797531 RepID=A0A1G1XPT5_9BACT|nr:MAG: hypothetical protein A2Y67_01135 [Candidatus Buchananbacteria bacterium RBG_13_39_9]